MKRIRCEPKSVGYTQGEILDGTAPEGVYKFDSSQSRVVVLKIGYRNIAVFVSDRVVEPLRFAGKYSIFTKTSVLKTVKVRLSPNRMKHLSATSSSHNINGGNDAKN
jgi:hypothetical protein